MAIQESMHQPGTPRRAVQCCECTILIGEGYHEREPIPAPDGRGYVCWRCFESLQRTTQRNNRQEV